MQVAEEASGRSWDRVSVFTRRRGELTGYAFVLPSIALLLTFSAYPLLSSIWLSLHEVEVFGGTSLFVGWDNYKNLFATAEFWRAVWQGLVFSVITVLLQLVAGVGTALILNRKFPGRPIARGLILFPFVVPTIVGVLIWKWMLNDLYGITNLVLIYLGIVNDALAWLGTPNLAMASVIIINVWMFFPFITIHALARLQVIPNDLYEAAKVDGAGPLQRFWYIVLPELRSTILLVVFIRGMWMFNKFDTIWLLTQGGPVGSTETLPVLAYLKAFREYQLGLGATVSVLIFFILCGLGWWYAKQMRRELVG